MLNFSQSQLKEIKAYCKLNDISDTDAFIKNCFEKGYNIEKYGLLSEDGKLIEKEIIVEKRVEVPVEVIKVVEVVKEVPVEKIVTIYDKIDNPELLLKIQQLENEMSNKDKELDEFRRNLEPNLDNNKVKMLETTLQNLRKELKLKNEKINELEDKLLKQNDRDIDATYLNGSNLNKKI